MHPKHLTQSDLDASIKPPPSALKMIGTRIGSFLVLSYAGMRKRYIPYVLCRCDCGSQLIENVHQLKRGGIKSCGCLKAALIIARITKHGRVGSKVYRTWKGLRSRCYNPNSTHFGHYGGRGIGVSNEWRDSFPKFLEDMGEPPTQDSTIERIDYNKGYCKENCCWIPRNKQGKNRRMNWVIEVDGVRMTATDACKKLGIGYNYTVEKLVRLGCKKENVYSLNQKGQVAVL